MPAKKKFTFRKEKPLTGLMSVGQPNPNTVIKHDKLQVGTIAAPDWTSKSYTWSVRLVVVCDEHPGWKWVTLKTRFATEPEARAHLLEHTDRILALGLHHFPKEEYF